MGRVLPDGYRPNSRASVPLETPIHRKRNVFSSQQFFGIISYEANSKYFWYKTPSFFWWLRIRTRKEAQFALVKRIVFYFFYLFFKYFIQHCFICCPSDSTVSEDDEIETRTIFKGDRCIGLFLGKVKGTVSRDFLLLVFFLNQFPPSLWLYHSGRFEKKIETV